MNKKKIVLLITLVVILILFFIIFYLINTNKAVICELNNDNYQSVIYIEKDEINFDYKYSFDTIEDSVNKYDMMSYYVELITKIDGVESSINQNKNIMEYSIKIDINKISKGDYKLLEIDKVIDLSNKEVIKYYEDLGYTCK